MAENPQQPVASTVSIAVPPGAPVQPAQSATPAQAAAPSASTSVPPVPAPPYAPASPAPAQSQPGAAPQPGSSAPQPSPSAQNGVPLGSIIAQTADGVQHVFPAGTPGNVIDNAIQTYVQQLRPGYQQASQQAQGTLASTPIGQAALALANGATFGQAARIAGAEHAAAQYVHNLFTGSQGQPTPGQAYDAYANTTNQDEQQFAAANPVTSTTLNIAGGLPAGGAMGKIIGAVPTVAGKIAAAIGTGAASGAAYGSGANMQNPTQGAERGAVEGAVLAPVTAGAGKLIGMGAATLGRTDTAQALQGAAARFLGPGTEVPPVQVPSSPGAVPSSVGAAATPGAAAAMSPAEATAARASAENYRLNNPLTGAPDTTVYVPGVKPTAAEVAANPTVSQIQKVTEQTPGNQAPFVERQAANNEARLNYFDDLAGTPTIVNQMESARAAQASQDLAQAWSNKTPVDSAPVLDTINSLLSGPEGKVLNRAGFPGGHLV